jgi:NADH:ubiquinone reductase (H+-translocating)
MGVDILVNTAARAIDRSSVTVKGPDGDRRIAGPHEDLGGRSAGLPLAAMLATATGADTDRAGRVAVHRVAACPVWGFRG